MLAVNAAVFFGVFLHKITLPPFVPYIHLLVDYHFGFTKRALIGAVVALFTSKVPVWLVFALGGVVWLITAGLFARLFRRTFGFGENQLPLFVFMIGSPFFLKNFMHTLGHFDIYGCLFAIVVLLIPARSLFYILLATLFSMILVLIHHIHLLMYVPVIATIVVLRLLSGSTRQPAKHHHRRRRARSYRPALHRRAVLRDDGGARGRLCKLSAWPDGRSVTNRPAEFYLHLVPAAVEGSCRYLGAAAAQQPWHSRVCAADLAAHAAVAIFCEPDRSTSDRHASPNSHRCDYDRQSRLSRDVRNGVRLFPMDFELGGVPVPDPARGEDAARLTRGGADIGR